MEDFTTQTINQSISEIIIDTSSSSSSSSSSTSQNNHQQVFTNEFNPHPHSSFFNNSNYYNLDPEHCSTSLSKILSIYLGLSSPLLGWFGSTSNQPKTTNNDEGPLPPPLEFHSLLCFSSLSQIQSNNNKNQKKSLKSLQNSLLNCQINDWSILNHHDHDQFQYSSIGSLETEVSE